MARRVPFSLSIDDDLLRNLFENNKNVSKYINECIVLRQAPIKLEKINVIQKHLQKYPNEIPLIIKYINSLKTMLEEL